MPDSTTDVTPGESKDDNKIALMEGDGKDNKTATPKSTTAAALEVSKDRDGSISDDKIAPTGEYKKDDHAVVASKN